MNFKALRLIVPSTLYIYIWFTIFTRWTNPLIYPSINDFSILWHYYLTIIFFTVCLAFLIFAFVYLIIGLLELIGDN